MPVYSDGWRLVFAASRRDASRPVFASEQAVAGGRGCDTGNGAPAGIPYCGP